MKALSLFLASTKNNQIWFLVGVGGVLLLWGLRMPGGDIPFLLTGAAMVLIALIYVLARIMTRLIRRLRKQPDTVPVYAGWCSWLLGAGLIVGIGLLGHFGVPFRWAFALSRPQLEQVVESYNKSQAPSGDFWAGVFPIASVEPIEGGVQFTFNKDEVLWGKRGVYFSGSGEPIERSYFYDQERIEALRQVCGADSALSSASPEELA